MRRPHAIIAAIALLVFTPAAPDAQQPLPPIETVETGQNRVILVNGEPFFPIMSWLQSPDIFPLLRSLGFNTFCGNQSGVPAVDQCAAARENGGYAVVHFDTAASHHPGLLGWIHGDEPDMPRRAEDDSTRWTPRTAPVETAENYARIKRNDPSGRPVFMTFTAHFMREFTNRYSTMEQMEYYPAFLANCDAAGFDIYPVYGWNRPAWLDYPLTGTRQLVDLAGGNTPVYAWIETHKGSKWVSFDLQLDVLPVHTRFETWGAVISGATAIGYFTHRWRPDFKEFSPTEEMRTELRRLNGQLTRLAPAILAPPSSRAVRMVMDGGLSCHVKTTELDGDLYLFAQNTDLGENAAKVAQHENISPRGGKAVIGVAGLSGGAVVEVVDEDRTIRAENGGFCDDFGPLEEHVYRIRLD